jgi:hypothetical protein
MFSIAPIRIVAYNTNGEVVCEYAPVNRKRERTDNDEPLPALESLDGLPSSPSSLGVGDAHVQEPAPKRPCVIDLCSDSEDPSDPVWDGSENGEGEVLEDCEDAEEEEKEEEPADVTDQYPDWLSYLPYDRAHDEPDTEWSDEEQNEGEEAEQVDMDEGAEGEEEEEEEAVPQSGQRTLPRFPLPPVPFPPLVHPSMDTVKDLGLPTHVSGWRLSKRLSMFESVKWRQNMPGDLPHAFLSGLCWDLKRVLQDYPEDQVHVLVERYCYSPTRMSELIIKMLTWRLHLHTLRDLTRLLRWSTSKYVH